MQGGEEGQGGEVYGVREIHCRKQHSQLLGKQRCDPIPPPAHKLLHCRLHLHPIFLLFSSRREGERHFCTTLLALNEAKHTLHLTPYFLRLGLLRQNLLGICSSAASVAAARPFVPSSTSALPRALASRMHGVRAAALILFLVHRLPPHRKHLPKFAHLVLELRKHEIYASLAVEANLPKTG